MTHGEFRMLTTRKKKYPKGMKWLMDKEMHSLLQTAAQWKHQLLLRIKTRFLNSCNNQ